MKLFAEITELFELSREMSETWLAVIRVSGKNKIRDRENFKFTELRL